MKTLLILVKKTTDPHIAALVEEYAGRLRHYISFDITVVPELKNNKKMTEQQQKQLEGEQILRCLQPGDHVVLLDERGRELRSVELAEWMTQKMNTLAHRLVFVIGGPYGFSDDVYAAAQQKLSLSKMTFSHQMVRLIFVEQLYRAMTIIRGEPYHHE
ncbi:MAG: 23S rRNA (pseudouridine(1915)-N(3))-methyltransferase RlmH [Bacteroidaceae bacterium]|jgi:23S rRNA (pseudouridine1915-N3)-methyltransferase|nr:23S rRNA (pseudouridine(1915)-N(3))-methyltransferase RlmH [Bacteroidaceae bacterium]